MGCNFFSVMEEDFKGFLGASGLETDEVGNIYVVEWWKGI